MGLTSLKSDDIIRPLLPFYKEVEALDVPIGLLNSSWGGSSAEPWVNRDTLATHADYVIAIRMPALRCVVRSWKPPRHLCWTRWPPESR